MRLRQLLTNNFLSLRGFKLKFNGPLVFLCGPNEVGKTSVANAISFAMTGVPRRAGILKKKDLRALISHGEKAGSVTLIVSADGQDEAIEYFRDIASARSNGPAIDDPIVPALLDMHAFSRMSPENRISMLYGRRPDFEEVKRLAVSEYEVNPQTVEDYRSWLEVSLQTAQQKIKENATLLKGMWREVTGETWGVAKGGDWHAKKAEAISGFGFVQCPHCQKPLAVGESGTVIALHEQDEVVSEEARNIHQRIMCDFSLFHAVSPHNIPARLAEKDIDALNDLLELFSEQSVWRRTSIARTGEIFVDDEPYYLLSESAQWRADAQITIALAIMSGWKFAILDRFDVLDLPGRSQAVKWLSAVSDRLDTVLVIATLKAAPSLDSTIFQTEWMG